MRKVSLQDFAAAVAARKQAVGLTDNDLASMRNSGRRRTPEKREALARIQRRAQDAGLTPLPAHL